MGPRDSRADWGSLVGGSFDTNQKPDGYRERRRVRCPKRQEAPTQWPRDGSGAPDKCVSHPEANVCALLPKEDDVQETKGSS